MLYTISAKKITLKMLGMTNVSPIWKQFTTAAKAVVRKGVEVEDYLEAH